MGITSAQSYRELTLAPGLAWDGMILLVRANWPGSSSSLNVYSAPLMPLEGVNFTDQNDPTFLAPE